MFSEIREDAAENILVLPSNGKFSGGNIFVDFNNQSYSWGKICG